MEARRCKQAHGTGCRHRPCRCCMMGPHRQATHACRRRASASSSWSKCGRPLPPPPKPPPAPPLPPPAPKLPPSAPPLAKKRSTACAAQAWHVEAWQEVAMGAARGAARGAGGGPAGWRRRREGRQCAVPIGRRPLLATAGPRITGGRCTWSSWKSVAWSNDRACASSAPVMATRLARASLVSIAVTSTGQKFKSRLDDGVRRWIVTRRPTEPRSVTADLERAWERASFGASGC